MTTRYAVRAAAAAATLALLAGCAQGEASTAEGQPDQPDRPERTLTVFAAASLQESFEAIGAAFERSHPGVTVRFGFGGSSGLVAQLADGAPADVLATANAATMDRAAAEGLVPDVPTRFATNRLQIVVPRDNPAGVGSLADLANPGTAVVLCAPAVPCGAAGVAVERAAGIDIRPVSEEQSVTDVLGKVRSGEADAGLVYVTDVRAAGGEVTGLDFPQAAEAVNTYPIAALEDATDEGLAGEFVAAVVGAEGQRVLRSAGFAAP
ncbi:molybdate ABC transporter substrate-binding protein [Knoellia sp. CPCC 206435]|uniref:molybdate ABC transporter substrate-binding protein n=1 Tax=Knoellia terrae TaxID=3404797 RepID=UPI003B42EEE1